MCTSSPGRRNSYAIVLWVDAIVVAIVTWLNAIVAIVRGVENAIAGILDTPALRSLPIATWVRPTIWF